MFQTFTDKINLLLRGLYSGLGFLLKGVNNPNIRADLHGIEDAECVPSMLKRNFKHAAVHALERLGLVRFAAFGTLCSGFVLIE